jgi:hypothetical protein
MTHRAHDDDNLVTFVAPRFHARCAASDPRRISDGRATELLNKRRHSCIPARLERARFGHGKSSAYSDAREVRASLITAHKAGQRAPTTDLPGIDAGVEGVRFIEAAVRSAAADGRWTPLGEEIA